MTTKNSKQTVMIYKHRCNHGCSTRLPFLLNESKRCFWPLNSVSRFNRQGWTNLEQPSSRAQRPAGAFADARLSVEQSNQHKQEIKETIGRICHADSSSPITVSFLGVPPFPPPGIVAILAFLPPTKSRIIPAKLHQTKQPEEKRDTPSRTKRFKAQPIKN